MKWSPAQSKAIEITNSNVIVSAGAGSGKTAVLVERILSLLKQDKSLRVSQILIMTFTEAAAGEMRQRIFRRLEQAVADADKDGDVESAKRFRMELENIWQAQISTIHSFCLELIQERVLALGLHPDFRLLGQNEQRVLLLDTIESVVENAYRGPKRAQMLAMGRALRLLDERNLVDVIRRIYDLARSQVAPNEWLAKMARVYPSHPVSLAETNFSKPFYGWVVENTDIALRSFQEALEISSNVPELDKYTGWLQEACNALSEIQGDVEGTSLTIDRMAEYFARYRALKTPSTRYKGPEVDLVKTLRETGQKALKLVETVVSRGEQALVQDLTELSSPITTLVELVTEVLDVLDEKKQKVGTLDFSDLEQFAYRILSNASQGDLNQLQSRYQHVFVDEYQDTSPIQDAIVSAMTHGRNNLFAVGDVKQSIYRFRMAEPALFLARYQKYSAGMDGIQVDLTDNYRSQPEVVHFINDVFAQLFTRENTDFEYDEHARMTPGATYPPVVDEQPLVEVHLMDRSAETQEDQEAGDAGGEHATSDDGIDLPALEREADFVAKRIREMIENQTLVFDKDAGENRPVQLGDVAILLRSGKDALNTVLSVLNNYGIAANASTSTGFYRALEVQWVMATLQVIDNPRNDLALVTFLRSPLVGLDEEHLARIRNVSRGALWDALRRVETVEIDGAIGQVQDSEHALQLPIDELFQTQIRRLMSQLRTWRKAALELGVSDLIEKVLEETDSRHYLQGMKRSKARLANVQHLVQMARSYDDRSGYGGLYGFLQQWQREMDADLDVGAAASAHADAVQVMTIHRSKGLEFPVVFVIDLGKQFRLPKDSIPLSRDLGIGAVAYDHTTQQRWRTVASVAMNYQEKRAMLAEEARILYVAFTRAREHLILVGSARNLAKKIFMSSFAHDTDTKTLLPGFFGSASSYMDWMIPVLLRHPKSKALREQMDTDVFDGRIFAMDSNKLSVHVYAANEFGGPSQEREAASAALKVADVERALASIASDVPETPSVQIRSSHHHRYNWLFGKVSATDMRRLHVALSGEERGQRRQGSAMSLLDDPLFAREKKVTGREQGVAFHAFMQRCHWPGEYTSEQAVADEVARLVSSGQLSRETADAIHISDVYQFICSDLGTRMKNGLRVFREQPFFHRIDVPVDPTGEETVPIVAQGVIDCLVEEADGWLVIDYKTDQVKRDEVRGAAREYQAQVATYLEALRPITSTKPVKAYLYFVRAQAAVEVSHMELPQIFIQLMNQRESSIEP